MNELSIECEAEVQLRHGLAECPHGAVLPEGVRRKVRRKVRRMVRRMVRQMVRQKAQEEAELPPKRKS